MQKITLASASPRRRELLGRLLSEFSVLADDTPEIKIEGEDPKATVQRLAMEKAVHVAKKVTDGLVIGADTVVVSDHRVLGKPKDREEAGRMLAALSGRAHSVLTGIAVVDAKSGVAHGDVEETAVQFRCLCAEEIAAYIASGEPMDKAGAYGIQELGALFVEGIRGDYFNVVGLPLCRLGKLLKERFSFDLLKARTTD